jgi:hypothetical protein
MWVFLPGNSTQIEQRGPKMPRPGIYANDVLATGSCRMVNLCTYNMVAAYTNDIQKIVYKEIVSR